MARHFAFAILCLPLVLAAWAFAPPAVARAEEKPTLVREIYVPFEDLEPLLEAQPRRVLLSREEYEDLLKKAATHPEQPAPQAAVVLSADYTATVSQDRADIAGTLVVEVLQKGLHAVPLDLSIVGLRSAQLDGKPAPLGQAEGGPLVLFVEGIGRHELVLQMVAPVETTAAQQVLPFRLPRPAAARLHLTVPGDVEVKGGADVVRRDVDQQAGVTRFELLPPAGEASLVMTLNSRLHRLKRVVVARSVVFDEVTEAYERLHATVSLSILHQAVDQFRFAVPDGFDITEVRTPQLARWAMATEGNRRVLDVRLRETTTDTVLLNIAAVRTPPPLDQWTMPRLEPLDVAGQSAVLGLLVDERLKAESLVPEGLIPIDTSVLSQAIPESLLRADASAPSLSSVAAWYAPQAQFTASARYVRPPVEMEVTTNVLLAVDEEGLEARGEFFLSPAVEKLFAADFSVPAGWHVTNVALADGTRLPFTRYGAVNEPGRIHVTLARAIPPGEEVRVDFQASSTPADWLSRWDAPRALEFPVFAVAGATRDVGAIAVDARNDLVVRPQTVDRLVPLDDAEKNQYGLGGVPTTLVYRYEARPYKAVFSVERTKPRITARTFSFLHVQSDTLKAHYEMVYHVEEARTTELALLLPEQTPASVSIEGLDDVRLKQYTAEVRDGLRRWDILLAEPRRGAIRLAVEFEQPLAEKDLKDWPLPVVRADGVAYQSGLVAVEGSTELDVRVATTARRLDVGELVDAVYQQGRDFRGLLGVYGFVGDPPAVKVTIERHPQYRLDPAIVQLAELVTRLSPDGTSQSSARFDLRSKASYLELALPPGSELWSAELDGTPIKPQREGESLLVSVPAAAEQTVRILRIVYQTPVPPSGVTGHMELLAPRLRLRTDPNAAAADVPMADLKWTLQLPPGYEVVRSGGTVFLRRATPVPAVLQLLAVAGGASFWSPLALEAEVPREAARRGQTLPSPYYMSDDAQYPNAPAGAEKEPEATPEAPDLLYSSMDEKLDREKEAKRETTGDVTREGDAARLTPVPTTEPKPDEPQPPAAGEEMHGEAMGRPVGGREGRERGQPQPVVPGEDVTVWNGQAQTRVAGEMPLGMPGPATAAPPSSTTPPVKAPPAQRGLQGFRSLSINLQDLPEGARAVTFQSLGEKPRLMVSLADEWRLSILSWAFGLVVLLVGLAMTDRSVRAKIRFLVGIMLVGSLLPLVPGCEATILPLNMAVYAAGLLVPWYLLVGLVRLVARFLRRRASPAPAAAAAAVVLALLAIAPAALAEQAKPGQDAAGPYVIEVVPPPEPVTVPEDAVILPYDPQSDTGVRDAAQMLVPYAKYVELWNRAFPEKPLDAVPPPAPYALAGASYTATLEGGEFWQVAGSLEIDVFVEEPVQIPLGLGGGVLVRADLDGKPARLSVPAVAPGPAPNQAPQQQAAPQPGPQQQPAANPFAQGERGPAGNVAPPGQAMVVLSVKGKGRHKLDLGVRLRLERRGGWRVVEGIVPCAPAASLAITVPQPQTEVRLRQVPDRRSYDTEQANQVIQTVLGPRGEVAVQWRPKVAEAEVDRSLTARSTAVFDVQEDGLRLVWQLALAFPRSQRDAFRVLVPKEYLVEKVEGGNVRGWELKEEGASQAVDVTLLKAARDGEQFSLRLWRGGPVGREPLAKFDVPVLRVQGAALESGLVTIRRSPLLEVHTEGVRNADRTDLGAEAARAAGSVGMEESPLGLRPYEAYRFESAPFTVALSAEPLPSPATAVVQSILKITDFDRTLETRVSFTVPERPIYRVEMLLPDDLQKLEKPTAPGDFQWALTKRGNRPLLTVYLATGQMGKWDLVVRGTLGREGVAPQVPLARVEVLGVGRQEGQIAVQVDPAFDVEAKDRQNCQPLLFDRLQAWMNPQNLAATRLALEYSRPDYGATLSITPRRPLVTCQTITNVRFTERSVEETVLLDYAIEHAGIRQVEFTLPASMAGCRVEVPGLRQKTIEPADARPGAPLRVRLDLQDEVMGKLRVLVAADRMITEESYAAAIPAVKDARTDLQYVVLQSAGRDEVVVAARREVEPLGAQDKQKLAQRLKRSPDDRVDITEAYAVAAGARDPQLAFKVRKREAVAMAGARIGLAEATLVVEADGSYRGQQTYWMDNTTEQFLVVELPEEARLWTARVAGDPVKPVAGPDPKNRRQLRIPLVKTSAGDLAYPVVLKYGGERAPLGASAWVDFPLVHSVSVKVELSQVRLYLPESHRWYDFGGTMRLADEDVLRAGFLGFQTKTAAGLVETLQYGDPFARARAENNLKNLKVILDNSRSMQVHDAGDKLQAAQRQNAAVFQEAEEELGKLQTSAEAGGQADDNRGRLSQLYQEQKVTRSRKVVKDVGGNWDVQAPPKGAPPAPAGQSSFNGQWLNNYRLNNPAVPQSSEQPGQSKPAFRGKPGKGGGEGKKKPSQSQFQAPSSGKGQPANQPAPTDESGRYDQGRGDAVERYQKQHEQQAQQELQQEGYFDYTEGMSRQPAPAQPPPTQQPGMNGGGQGMPGMPGGEQPGVAYSPDADRLAVPQAGGFGYGAVGGMGGGGFAAPGGGPGTGPGMGPGPGVAGPGPGIAGHGPGGPAAGTGLTQGMASLDVEIPLRGTPYFFTTPQGDVQITARAASEDTIARAGYAVLTVVCLLIVLCVVHLARRGFFWWLVGPIGSLCLIVAGAVSLLLFPLLGLVLLLGGIAARLRRAESSETLEVHGGGETASGSPLSPGP